MLQYISLAFLIFTSLVGIYELVNLIVDKIFKEYKKTDISFLVVDSMSNDIELLLRGVCKRTKSRVTVFDFGMNNENLEKVKRIQQKESKILIKGR